MGRLSHNNPGHYGDARSCSECALERKGLPTTYEKIEALENRIKHLEWREKYNDSMFEAINAFLLMKFESDLTPGGFSLLHWHDQIKNAINQKRDLDQARATLESAGFIVTEKPSEKPAETGVTLRC